MNIQIANQQVTMTSLDLVDFINSTEERESELRHDHFMAKVPKVLGEGAPKFRDTHVNPQNGQSYPIYRLPKREACLMAMSYSYDLQAKVYDRMTELESQAAKPAELSRMDLIKLAMEAEQERLVLVEKVEVQQLLIESQAPKAAFFDTVATAANCQSFEQTAKVCQTGRNRLIRYLRERRILKHDNLPYQHYIDAGYFKVIETSSYVNGQPRNFTSTKVTGKGLTWIQSNGYHLPPSGQQQIGTMQ
jgi:phage antirepressor YoqD-like protein